jgi:O-antigen/teichoic acid export membrane protein
MQENNTHKQAFWFTIINYVGILIGVFSTVFIYPNDKDFLGKVGFVDSIAQMLFPVFVFGGAQALIHFYPNLSEENKKKLFKYGIVTILSIAVVVLVVLLLGQFAINWDKYNYLFFAFPLALVLALIEFFKRQSANLQKIAIPTFYEKIIPKIALPMVFVLVLAHFFTESTGIIVFVGFYFLLLLLVAQYLSRYFSIKGNWNFQPLFQSISKTEYYNYCFYSFLGSFGSFLAFRIDGFMIPLFLEFDDNGAYRIAVNLSSALAIPATGLFIIYAPQVSHWIKNKEFDVLKMKYIETSKLLFFIGALIFGCVIVGVESFFSLLPTADKLMASLPVIYILGANVVFNMATGFNSEIISYSQYYRFNIVAVLVLVVLNISLNYYYLTQTDFGISGVAIASLVSMSLFNIAKLIFIYKKFRILPFDWSYAKLILIMILFTFGIYSLPQFSNLCIDVIIKVTLLLISSLLLIYQLKLLPLFNYWVDKITRQF